MGFIKSRLADQLVDGIRYEKIDEWYEMTQFETEIDSWADYIVPSTEKNGVGGTHIYDGVPFESETIEKPFIEALEKRKDVKLYIKPPCWFTVATPIGQYNPDWAIVMENPEAGEDLLYLVRETKGSLNLPKLAEEHRSSIFSYTDIRDDMKRDSLMRFGARVAESGIDAPGPYRAGRDFLLRRTPRPGAEAVAGEDMNV